LTLVGLTSRSLVFHLIVNIPPMMGIVPISALQSLDGRVTFPDTLEPGRMVTGLGPATLQPSTVPLSLNSTGVAVPLYMNAGLAAIVRITVSHCTVSSEASTRGVADSPVDTSTTTLQNTTAATINLIESSVFNR